MTTTTTDTTPRAWPACLACYNDGRLVGRWVDCTDAEEVTLEQLHEGTSGPYASCEEIWCLDHENLPVRGEMGLLEAAEWGRVFEEVGAEQWPALRAWVDSGAHVVEGHGPIPSISDFEERYCGHWDSFREYAEQLAEDLDLMDRWPDEARRYFNWSSWVADQRHDFTVCDVPWNEGGGVHVFRNL